MPDSEASLEVGGGALCAYRAQTCLGANVPSGRVPSIFFLRILGALSKGKGWGAVESLHMFFTKTCPSGGTKCASFELLWGILRGPGKGRGGRPWYGTFAKPEGRFAEGMFEKC